MILRTRTNAVCTQATAMLKHYTVFDTPIVSSFCHGLAMTVLRVFGWRLVGQLPDIPRYVAIGAPHTSWWDGLFGLAIAFAYKVKFFWLAKNSVFRWPFGPVFRWLGGIPVDRSRKHDLVGQCIRAFQHSDHFILTLLPEGTRERVESWKSGFYHIAVGANVPVVLGFLDYPKKIGGVGPALAMTGDVDIDMAAIRSFYASKTGKHPDRTGPIRLLPRKP